MSIRMVWLRRSDATRLVLGVLVAAVYVRSSAAAQVCAGDCDGDGTIVVAELVQAVGISLGSAAVDRCPASDTSGDGRVGINELVAAVDAMLGSCPTGFLQRFTAVQGEAAGMTPAAFATRYAPAPAVETLSYDPLTAALLAPIDATLQLGAEQRAVLQRNGFVVAADVTYPSFAVAYEQLYVADLPVFISSDSLLYALHRSYDRILMDLEQTVLIDDLQRLLDGLHATLATKRAGGRIPLALSQAERDVDVYLAVARTLLSGQPVGTQLGPDSDGAAAEILAAVTAEQPAPLPLFGRPDDEPYDFSQMKPRGHYTDTRQLERYFRAMMWLGRTEMALVRTPRGRTVFNRAALDAAFLLHLLLRDSEQRPRWDRVNLVIERMVGEKDSMDPVDMAAFATANQLDDLPALAAVSDAELEQTLLASSYGQQRIMSQILESDPEAPTLPLPRVFLLLGQRFTIDAYVFHRLTYDRLVDPASKRKMRRMLPQELDVQFALGSNTAGALLADEIGHFNYQGALHETRFLVESHPVQFWDANLYNGWLNAIRALNDDLTAAGRPESLRTEAWARKSLETQLAAWAELRHDTLLYAKQSYSGGITCTYPDAYVEPAPHFLDRMAHIGRLGSDMAERLQLAGLRTDMVRAYFDNFTDIMQQLQRIAEKELDGTALAQTEWDFLRMAIEKEIVGCGETHYDGWYPSLFFSASDVTEFQPTIADIHTAPTDESGNLVGWVLHAGTGRTRPMVVTVNGCDGPRAYVGPVSTYHSLRTEQFLRLTDGEWLDTLDDSDTTLPWSAAYRR